MNKGNGDRCQPIAPEFAEFVLATPQDERNGFVFRPLPERYRHRRETLDYIK